MFDSARLSQVGHLRAAALLIAASIQLGQREHGPVDLLRQVLQYPARVLDFEPSRLTARPTGDKLQVVDHDEPYLGVRLDRPKHGRPDVVDPLGRRIVDVQGEPPIQPVSLDPQVVEFLDRQPARPHVGGKVRARPKLAEKPQQELFASHLEGRDIDADAPRRRVVGNLQTQRGLARPRAARQDHEVFRE